MGTVPPAEVLDAWLGISSRPRRAVSWVTLALQKTDPEDHPCSQHKGRGVSDESEDAIVG